MERLTALLDRAVAASATEVPAAYAALATGLAAVRAGSPPAEWRAVIERVVRRHALFDAVLVSPLARRLRSKPRGESTDAILLDLMYGIGPDADGDERASAIYAFERELPSIAAYRDACAAIRGELLRIAALRPDPRALALSCGHLRELDVMALAHLGSAAQVLALDSDPASIASVRRRFIDPRVRSICADPAAVAVRLRNAGHFFDLVYRIVPVGRTIGWSEMCALLRPGGVAAAAVLADRRPDAAYLEACLDWWPPEWNRDDVRALAAEMEERSDLVTTADVRGVMLYLRVERRAADKMRPRRTDRTLRGRYAARIGL